MRNSTDITTPFKEDPASPKPTKSMLKPLTEGQFHTVWTEAVGRSGYDKKLFQEVLQSLYSKGLIHK